MATEGAVEPAAGPSVTAGLLGLGEHELDDLKAEAVQALAPRASKKPKLTHELFFDDERGLRKVIRDFPKLRFKGKGHEFSDLQVLIGSYKRWFKELYPFEDNMEDLVWKSRAVLQEKVQEKGGHGFVSDPREQLHMLRLEYKRAGGGGTKAAAENAAAAKATPKRVVPQLTELSDDVRARIEANRQKALELKKKRQQAQAQSIANPASDDPALSDPVPAGPDDEEDVFGFGGGLDDEEVFGSAPPKAAPPSHDDEEDVFGFGGGMDEDDGPPQPPAPPPAQTPPVVKPLDPEVAKRVAENKARALALKRKREAEKEAAAATSATPAIDEPKHAEPPAEEVPPSAPAPQAPAPTVPDEEEEDPFGFGGGIDDM
eukprot:TRINITY_DN1459_c0_g1_i1.p1 TRINITY_DN1459_c0_g1~~TRINITY_DN1459_c0_g1_i1.p1  ORF type:complete len:400 (-),score=154.69 TRINITY_DN1459_c0_g1_i1:461-1579(-)